METSLCFTESRRASFDLLFYCLEDDEEDGNDEKQGDGTDDHAADGSHAERMVTIGADTCSQSERQEAEDHRHGGHKDGAQSDGSGIESCLDDAKSLTSARSGVLS